MERRTFVKALAGPMLAATLPGWSKESGTDALRAAEAAARLDKTKSWSADIAISMAGPGQSPRVRKGATANQLREDGAHAMRFFRFSDPPDLAGTSLLIHENAGKDDDIWLYLPSAGKARRIVSNNLKNGFVGTEFSFVNLMTQQVDRYDHAFSGEEAIDGVPCLVLESKPKTRSWAEDIGYSLERAWMRKNDFAPLRVEYIGLKGRAEKRQDISDYLPTETGHLIARKRKMTHLTSGRTTLMELSKVVVDGPFEKSLFRPNSLGQR
jgi:hypothetical protein